MKEQSWSLEVKLFLQWARDFLSSAFKKNNHLQAELGSRLT